MANDGKNLFIPLLLIPCAQYNSYQYVFRAHLMFQDGPGCLNLCSCMVDSWGALGGVDLRGSNQADFLGPGQAYACRHSRAAKELLGEEDGSAPASCSSLGEVDFSPPFPVQQLDILPAAI